MRLLVARFFCDFGLSDIYKFAIFSDGNGAGFLLYIKVANIKGACRCVVHKH